MIGGLGHRVHRFNRMIDESNTSGMLFKHHMNNDAALLQLCTVQADL